MLEPYEWKRSRTVLRRERASNRPDLADYFPLVQALHGQVVRLATNSKDYLNPMDIQLSHKGDKEALKFAIWAKDSHHAFTFGNINTYCVHKLATP